MTGMLATIFLLSYAIVCIVSGLAGAFWPRCELSQLFHLSLDAATVPALSDFLLHYRFAGAIMATFGLFILLYRRDILDGAQPALIFFAGGLLGAASGVGSWWSDGAPTFLFTLLLFAQIATLALVFVYSRRDRGAP